MEELHFSPPAAFMVPDSRSEYERGEINLTQRTEEIYARIQHQRLPSFVPQLNASSYRLQDHLVSPRKESDSTSYASFREPVIHPRYQASPSSLYGKN